MFTTTSNRASAAEKHPISRVRGLVDIVVAQPVEKNAKFGFVRGGYLHADEHPAVIGAVVPIVKQADVPARAHAVEKTHQRSGPLRKFESVQDFVGRGGRVAADEMADVELGHFV